MFFSEFILTKKGALAKIWLAAHWDRKLTKTQVTETDINEAVNGIIKPVVPIALRTSGHLLLGVVKIYSKKVKYVLADCNETLTKITLQVVPDTKVDLPERSLTANVNAITLPERVSELDLIIPEYDISALAATAASAFISDTMTIEEEPTGGRLVARMQDITLDDFDNWYTDEDLGEVFPAAFGLTQTPASAEALRRAAQTPASVEQLRQAPTFEDHELYATSIEFPLPRTEEWGGEGGEIGFEGIPPSPKSVEASRLSTALSELGTPTVTTPGIVPTTAVEPTVVEPAPTRPKKRPRGVQIDKEMEIPSKRFREMLERGPTRVSRSAPRTPHELVLAPSEVSTFQELTRQPAIGVDLPSPFLDLFRRNLEYINVRQPLAPAEVAREVEAVPRGLEIEPTEFEFGGVETGFEPEEFRPEEPIPERRISAMPSPIPSIIEDDIDDIAIDVYKTPDQRRRASQALGRPVEAAPIISDEERNTIIQEELARERELREKSRRDQEELRRTYTDKSITERTLKVLNIFNETFKAQDEINLNTMVEGKKRITAARCFYELLVLKTKNFVDVKQDRPYGDIIVTKTDRLSVH